MSASGASLVEAGTGLARALRFAPWREACARPNLVVDGAPNAATVLTLSHWPNNPTPAAWRRDTSTATVFAWLDAGADPGGAEVVSNSHFDEDGLFGIFAACHPRAALARRALLEDAAQAGDFGVFERRDAARLVFAVESLAAPAVSPLPREVFAGCERRRAGALYAALLDRVPELVDDLAAAAALWRDQDEHLEASLAMVEARQVVVEERPEFDLAIVRIPTGLPARSVRRYLGEEQDPVHPFALHAATRCSRLLRIQGRRFTLQYRYEGWVRLVTRRPALRVALAPLAAALNERERAPGRWRAEPVTDVAPRLVLDGCEASSLSAEDFIDAVCAHLGTAPPAWDPYDWPGA